MLNDGGMSDQLANDNAELDLERSVLDLAELEEEAHERRVDESVGDVGLSDHGLEVAEDVELVSDGVAGSGQGVIYLSKMGFDLLSKNSLLDIVRVDCSKRKEFLVDDVFMLLLDFLVASDRLDCVVGSVYEKLVDWRDLGLAVGVAWGSDEGGLASLVAEEVGSGESFSILDESRLGSAVLGGGGHLVELGLDFADVKVGGWEGLGGVGFGGLD